jgi:hypothetical protein
MSPPSLPLDLAFLLHLSSQHPLPRRSVFHEYPHPDNWSQIVDELYSRFGADGEDYRQTTTP